MHVTLSYSEIQPIGHGYLNCLLSCSCIISLDLGLPTQVQRVEHFPIAELFILERARYCIWREPYFSQKLKSLLTIIIMSGLE